MKNSYWLFLLPLVLLTGCKGQKKLTQYSELYQENPAVIYIAPLNDRSERHPMRTADDSVYNASLNVATKQLYLTASDPLVHNGYYVLGPLASAQLAATESRTGNQLRTENIQDYHTNLGIDAILFITSIGGKIPATHGQPKWSMRCAPHRQAQKSCMSMCAPPSSSPPT